MKLEKITGEECLKNYLEKIFPNAEITVKQSFGIIKCYIQLSNYFLGEIITDVIGKTDIQIVNEISQIFIEKLMKFVVNEKEYLKIRK